MAWFRDINPTCLVYDSKSKNRYPISARLQDAIPPPLYCLNHHFLHECTYTSSSAAIREVVVSSIQSRTAQCLPHLQRHTLRHAAMGFVIKPQRHVLLPGRSSHRYTSLPRIQKCKPRERHAMARFRTRTRAAVLEQHLQATS